MTYNRFDTDVSLDELLDGLLEEGDSGITTDSYGEKMIPASKVSQIVQQRLAKASRSVETTNNEFRTLFGVRPDELVQNVKTGAWTPDEAMRIAQGQIPQVQPVQMAPAQQPQPVQVPAETDVASRVNRIETDLRLREEADEFKVNYAGVPYEAIPLEVKQYRATHPNVTITEAMDMYLGRNRDKQAEFIKRQGAEDAMRSMQRGKFPVSESSSTVGVRNEDINTLSPDDRHFITDVFGMDPKQWVAANKKYQRALGEQNLGGVT